MLTTARMAMISAALRNVSRIIESGMRIMPKVPIFNRTPARIADTGPGELTCAGGSQVWTGNSGVLMTSPTKIATNARPAVKPCPARGCSAMSTRMSNVNGSVSRYRARKPSSITSEPASVYRKNLSAASFASPCPHRPIRKYMPTRLRSKNT